MLFLNKTALLYENIDFEKLIEKQATKSCVEGNHILHYYSRDWDDKEKGTIIKEIDSASFIREKVIVIKGECPLEYEKSNEFYIEVATYCSASILPPIIGSSIFIIGYSIMVTSHLMLDLIPMDFIPIIVISLPPLAIGLVATDITGYILEKWNPGTTNHYFQLAYECSYQPPLGTDYIE